MRQISIPSFLNVLPSKLEPLNEEMQEVYNSALFVDGEISAIEQSNNLVPILQIILEHLAIAENRISVGLALFVTHLSKDNKDLAKLWAYTINRHAVHYDSNHVLCLNDFMEAFPNGLPTEAAMFEIWCVQKERLRDLIPWFEGYPLDMVAPLETVH